MPDRKTTNTTLLETAKRIEKMCRDGRKGIVRKLRGELRVPDDSEDVLHDALVKLLVCGVPESVVNFNGYVVRVARRVAIDRYRRRTEQSVAPAKLEELLELHAQQEHSAEEKCMINDKWEEFLEQLTPEQRVAVQLVKGAGLTYRQAAAAMNISERRIERLLGGAMSRARQLGLGRLDRTSGERK
ncbi:RNA polymerase sigma factor [Steroidobacter flavus]|uniref:RNA polymerase sigma factor n=1 Tax=Steroidobacter flavus TaxID=1842136 RepID=A0ABV8SLP6_9GAMM